MRYIFFMSIFLGAPTPALRREHEIQVVRLCEITKQNKKVEQDRENSNEYKRKMTKSINERVNEVQRLTLN